MVKIFWFRKDLRLFDNKALSYFLNDIKPKDNFLFLYVKNINSYSYFGEKRINFLLECLRDLENQLKKQSLNLYIYKGNSLDCFKFLLGKFHRILVYANKQVEPYCNTRDDKINSLLHQNNSDFFLYDDTTLFSPGEVVKENQRPYTVFTPYKNKCTQLINTSHYQEQYCNLSKLESARQIIITSEYDIENEMKSLGNSSFINGGRHFGKKFLNEFIIKHIDEYKSARDYPFVKGTSLLSPHLHFGTVSVRECYRAAIRKLSSGKNKEDIETWINELFWREFYYQITYFFPYVLKKSFKTGFDILSWNNNKSDFNKWCEGKTGYPIIDAGINQLKKEGWVHNRIRMILAMFLTKDLFIDWRMGERFFAENLIDFDFSSNNGGWQWSASTGCDAQPYFRIFNPYLQSKKFDPDGEYIRKYLGVLKNLPNKYIHKPDDMPLDTQNKYEIIIGKDYPYPIVNHSSARDYALLQFKKLKFAGT